MNEKKPKFFSRKSRFFKHINTSLPSSLLVRHCSWIIPYINYLTHINIFSLIHALSLGMRLDIIDCSLHIKIRWNFFKKTNELITARAHVCSKKLLVIGRWVYKIAGHFHIVVSKWMNGQWIALSDIAHRDQTVHLKPINEDHIWREEIKNETEKYKQNKLPAQTHAKWILCVFISCL